MTLPKRGQDHPLPPKDSATCRLIQLADRMEVSESAIGGAIVGEIPDVDLLRVGTVREPNSSRLTWTIWSGSFWNLRRDPFTAEAPSF